MSIFCFWSLTGRLSFAAGAFVDVKWRVHRVNATTNTSSAAPTTAAAAAAAAASTTTTQTTTTTTSRVSEAQLTVDASTMPAGSTGVVAIDLAALHGSAAVASGDVPRLAEVAVNDVVVWQQLLQQQKQQRWHVPCSADALCDAGVKAAGLAVVVGNVGSADDGGESAGVGGAGSGAGVVYLKHLQPQAPVTVRVTFVAA